MYRNMIKTFQIPTLRTCVLNKCFKFSHFPVSKQLLLLKWEYHRYLIWDFMIKTNIWQYRYTHVNNQSHLRNGKWVNSSHRISKIC